MGAFSAQDAPGRFWRRAAAVTVLVIGACESRADWRYDEAFARFDAMLGEWLDDEAAASWTRAVESADRASRLGPALLEAASRQTPRVAELAMAIPAAPPVWLDDPITITPALRLAFAERLMLVRRYDDCLVWLEGVSSDEVFSPALLRYVRAVALRSTVDDEAARAELVAWEGVEREVGVAELGAARWWLVESLLRETAAEPSPVPVIGRRMEDISRRLALGEADEETGRRQQKVLDEIDELIEKLEEQRKQQQQQAGAGGAGGGAEPMSPAEESRPGTLKGAGEVDRKRLVAGDAWGELPPAERERLRQLITREFPARDRGLIEDYFRTIAEGEPVPGNR